MNNIILTLLTTLLPKMMWEKRGAGREKTRVGSSQREKAGEIEGGMQPKNTMFNISK